MYLRTNILSPRSSVQPSYHIFSHFFPIYDNPTPSNGHRVYFSCVFLFPSLSFREFPRFLMCIGANRCSERVLFSSPTRRALSETFRKTSTSIRRTSVPTRLCLSYQFAIQMSTTCFSRGSST